MKWPPRIALACAVALGSFIGYAQDDEEVFELSPFRVDSSDDQGYRATNTISGTRLNTKIKDIPLSVEAITEEFIEDVGALDVREALEFSSGVLLSSEIANDTGEQRSFDFSPSNSGGGFATSDDINQGTLKIRGYTTNTMLRNGFTVPGNLSSADLGRIEVARGPQALLYGVNSLGGIVNTIPKYPTAAPRYSTSLTVGGNDLFRTIFDASGPVSDTFSYRVIGEYQERGIELDDYLQTDISLSPKFEYRPTEKTSVYLDMQINDRTIDGYQSSSTQNLSVGGNFGVNQDGRNDFRESYRLREVLNLPHTASFLKGDEYNEDSFLAAAMVEHEFTENFRMLVGHQMIDVEKQNARTNASVITYNASDELPPEATVLDGSGNLYAIRGESNRNFEDQQIDQTRVEFNYSFEVGETNHSFLLGRNEQKTTLLQHTTTRDQDYNLAPVSPAGIMYDPSFRTRGFRDIEDQRWNTGHYLVYHGKFLQDKLNVIAGLRRDRYMIRNLRYTYVDEDENGTWERFSGGPDGSSEDAPGRSRDFNAGPGTADPDRAPVREGYRFGGVPKKDTNPTIGLSYALNDKVTAYVVSAEGIVPNPGQRNGLSENFDNETTESFEVGLKFELIEGKLSGAVAAFEIDRSNAVYFFSSASSPRNAGPPREERRNRFNYVWDRSYSVPISYFDEGYVPVAPETADNNGEGWMNVNQLIADGEISDSRYYINYETLDQNPQSRAAIDAAMANGEWLYGGNSRYFNAPSMARGSDVPFGDTAEGADAQLIFTPSDDWQFTFNYAYIDRVITQGFELVPFIVEGQSFGTEYDVWVRFLGEENFTDLMDPSTFNGNALIGAKLDDSPEHSFSLWSKKTWNEGPLDGFNASFGLIYAGERQTAVDVAGGNPAVVGRPTPMVPDRFEGRLAFGYRKLVNDKYLWNFRANVYNLFDDQKDEAIASYPEDTVYPFRRTVRYYAPRSFRLTAGVSF